MAIPTEKWRHPDAWEIRKGGWLEVGETVVQRATRSFAFGEENAARSSLLSNLLAGCVFRRKIDYGRIGRESQKDSSSFTRERKNRAGFSSYLNDSSKERACLINGSSGASICASLEEYNL